MLSVDKLRKVAIYGGAFTVASCAFFYYKIQSRFASGDYYRISLEALRKDERLTNALGPPVSSLFLDLGNKNNSITAHHAELTIPVRGSKYKGLLHTKCSIDDQENWKIDSLVLEVNQRQFPVKFDNAPKESDEILMD